MIMNLNSEWKTWTIWISAFVFVISSGMRWSRHLKLIFVLIPIATPPPYDYSLCLEMIVIEGVLKKMVLSDFLETENVCLNFLKNLKIWAFYWRNIPAKEVQDIPCKRWIRFWRGLRWWMKRIRWLMKIWWS